MNHPVPNMGYYQGSSGDITSIQLKCKFCKSPVMPTSGHHAMIAPGGATSWLCIGCPTPIMYDWNLEDFTLMVTHNDHWYEIQYLQISGQYLVFRWETSLVVQPENGNEHYSNSRTLVKQIKSEQNITPTNAKDKLLTILTFS